MGENKEYIVHPGEKGNINISEDVVAVIAANAAKDTDGVAGLSSNVGRDIAELVGRKVLPKGVKITVTDDGITVDVCLTVKFGSPVGEVGEAVQKNVVAAIEAMTGFKVGAVNVHVSGIAMGK